VARARRRRTRGGEEATVVCHVEGRSFGDDATSDD